MAERQQAGNQQNWERRSFINLGHNFKIDTQNPQLGEAGENVYQIYGVTDAQDQSTIGLSQSGLMHIYNDRDIHISAGFKNETQGVDISINSFDGDIALTALKNGSIRLKGRNICLEALEDIDLLAGRNITLTAGSLIKLKAPKVEICEETGFLGNVINALGGTLLSTVFGGTPLAAAIGGDVISQIAGGPIGNLGQDIVENLF